MGYAVSFLTIAEFLQSYYVIPVAMVIFVTFVMYFFVKQYWFPAKRLAQNFDEIIQKLKEDQQSHTAKHVLDEIFSEDGELKHAWENYKNSLHDIREEVDGESKIIASRSTVSSDAFFLISRLLIRH